jgi:hypothetical protein
VDTSLCASKGFELWWDSSLEKFWRQPWEVVRGGNALAIVEITGESFFCTRLETSGVLAYGTEYHNKFPFLRIDCFIDGGDPYLGTRLPVAGGSKRQYRQTITSAGALVDLWSTKFNRCGCHQDISYL